MSEFAVPPRKVAGLDVGPTYVRTLNGLTGDIVLAANSPLSLATVDGIPTFGIQDGYFVRRGGDTFAGNLEFTPTAPGPYGLRLLATSIQPTQSAVGALYLDTSGNTLRVYTSSGWQDVAQAGALTLAAANALYLKLDGSNDPMTGDLNLGSALLRLGNKASDPPSGSLGELFFNTSTNKARIYTAPGAWSNLGEGISQIDAGSGILLTPDPIVSTGEIALDFSVSPTWTGNHTFDNPIVFASGQTFSIAGLSAGGQATGDLIHRTGAGWTRLAIGTTGQILTVSSGLPAWQDPPTGTTSTIGLPSDSAYDDGFFEDWVASTPVAAAFDDVNELLRDIVPAQGDSLVGTALTETSVPTMYGAKLSSGLTSADWYQGGKVAGDTISTYCLGSSFTLDSPSQSDTFQLGWKGNPTTFGTLHHVVYASGSSSNNASYDLTTNISGSSGSLAVDLSTYNGIWRIGAGTITYTHSGDGYVGHTLNHTATGETLKREYWRDTHSSSNPNPSFATPAAVAEDTPVDKWISGVLYYDLGSTLEVTFVAAAGIFNRCYHPTNVATVACAGSATASLLPASPPAYNATYDRLTTPVPVTLDVSNQATPPPLTTRNVTVGLYKPSGATVSSTAALARPVNTYPSNHSTDTAEYFFDEGKRLRAHPSTAAFGSYSSSGAFDTVGNYAQVRNGRLCYPVVADYEANPSPYNYTPVFADEREYERYFVKASASTGTLTFTGLSVGNISEWGSGQLNILIYLEDDAKWFDLGVDVGAEPGTRDGSSRALAFGARNTGSSGGVLNWSIGTYTTGTAGSGNDAKFRLVVAFQDSTYTISSIVST